MLGNPEDQILINEITNDLNKKSLDELIYLNFNPEHFINEFTIMMCYCQVLVFCK